MKKSAYYFSHDSNARNDERILAVRMRHKAEGYAVYFMLLERLLESTNYMSAKDYNVIAFDLRVSAEVVKSIVEDFDLFTFSDDGKFFYSESFLKRMKPLDNLRDQRREAGIKSAEKRTTSVKTVEIKQESNDRLTTVERSLSKNPTKERKGKEIKEKERVNAPPSVELKNSNHFRQPRIPVFQEVHEVFVRNGGTEAMAKSFFDRNEATGWFFKGSPITNYVSMVGSFISNWKRNEKSNPESTLPKISTQMREL